MPPKGVGFTDPLWGTINFELNKIKNLSENLEEFEREGREIAKNIAGAQNVGPSTMSLMLRSDFFAD